MDPVQCEQLVSSAAAEERTCPVCLEEIDRARVLDCGHCICDTCASRYCRNLLGRAGATVGPVPCPKCRNVALVALDAEGHVGLPETGKLSALVAVCRGLVNNPGLFLGIEEDELPIAAADGDGDNGDSGEGGDLEASLQSRLQAAGAELSDLANQASSLRLEMRDKAAELTLEEAAAAAGDEAAADNDDEAAADNDDEAATMIILAKRLADIFDGPADRLIRRQEAARLRLEAAWLQLRCLQFARGCYGNAFLGNFPKAWRILSAASPEVKLAASQGSRDEVALQLRRDSFVRWAVAMATGEVGPEDPGTGAVAADAGDKAAQSPPPEAPLVQPRLLWKVGQGGDGPLQFRWPVHANFVSGGRVAVCDKNNCRVQLLSLKDGAWLDFLGNGSVKPRRILQAKNGNFYICDENAACVKVFNQNMELVGRLGEGIFQCPSGIGETRSGNLVFSDLDHAFVVVINPDTGVVVRKFHTRLADDVYIPSPHFITIDEDDYIVVSDSLNNTVKIFDPRGRISGRIRGFNCPRGLALDHQGNLLVVNADTHSVSLFTNVGKHLQDLLCADDGLNFPMSAAFDKERRLLLITQCSVHGRYEVLLFKLDYAGDRKVAVFKTEEEAKNK